tara:strand:- start:283 stop:681 length:399 start_codon:yes stop_codon:yes gene_type:complete
MTNVKSIYGSNENSNAEEAEVIIMTEMDECFKHFLSLMEDLIIEDNRNKKSLRYIRSEKLLINSMALHLTYIEIINELIVDYIYLYGKTAFIKKTIVITQNRLFPFFDEKLKPFMYLIDMSKIYLYIADAGE